MLDSNPVPDTIPKANRHESILNSRSPRKNGANRQATAGCCVGFNLVCVGSRCRDAGQGWHAGRVGRVGRA
jgi:hypothetical protein